MTDPDWDKLNEDASDQESGLDPASLPHELPPVQPPSAGLIIQLFLVPALIVGVIVALYALFGRMTSQDLDWHQLVVDVRSENPHVRWRGALGLAQMLDADARRPHSSQQQRLATVPEVATALADLYQQLISIHNPREDETKQIEFLSKALGRMDVPEIVLPALRAGISPDRDHDVRKHSLIGLSMALGVQREHQEQIVRPELETELIEISQESERLFRHQATFALGLLATPAAMNRLEVLLEDVDQMTRVNAAIGFARNGQLDGLPVFHELFNAARDWKLNPSLVKTPEAEAVYFERMLMLTNGIKAVDQLVPKLNASEREQFRSELDAVANSTQDAVLKNDALSLKVKLRG